MQIKSVKIMNFEMNQIALLKAIYYVNDEMFY